MAEKRIIRMGIHNIILTHGVDTRVKDILHKVNWIMLRDKTGWR